MQAAVGSSLRQAAGSSSWKQDLSSLTRNQTQVAWMETRILTTRPQGQQLESNAPVLCLLWKEESDKVTEDIEESVY